MTITTMTSREFNQDASKAKRIAAKGPVFITDRGKLAHVLLTVKEYERISNEGISEDISIVDLLSMPDSPEVNFEIPKFNKSLYRPADLS